MVISYWPYGLVLMIVLVGMTLLPGCSSANRETQVMICETDTTSKGCAEDQNKFTVGQQLSAHLIAGKPFVAQTIIGKILRLSGSDTIPLGNRMITLEPGQQSIVQSLPFHEFGEQAKGQFLVQFVDGQNQLIAEKAFTIQ